jgi:hypothetical protein
MIRERYSLGIRERYSLDLVNDQGEVFPGFS